MSEAAFLLRTGWSYPDYMDTPDEVVTNISILLSAENEARGEPSEEEDDVLGGPGLGG